MKSIASSGAPRRRPSRCGRANPTHRPRMPGRRPRAASSGGSRTPRRVKCDLPTLPRAAGTFDAEGQPGPNRRPECHRRDSRCQRDG
jgi:hypothetical protein